MQTISQSGVQGMRDIRLFTLGDELVDRMGRALDLFYSAGVRLNRNQSALSNLNQLTNAIVVFALVYAGIRFTSLSLGAVGVFLFAVFRLSPTLTQLNNVAYALDGTFPHLIRVNERIDSLASNARETPGSGSPVSRVEQIAFDEVSFAYGDGEAVLRDVSFSVERGERIAIVGQSGAGKSTIVSLIGRFYRPDSGRILADGRDVTELAIGQWRERLAVVRQDPYVFDDTLEANLTVGDRDASAAAIDRACEVAQVTEFLDDLPNGYDTRLGEDGVRLSGGQKQRVAIARALLKDADVLVFDEATSELDSTIEELVYAGIAAMESRYAIVSIAHRLSTIDDADRIYALANGRVVEVGTHEELVAGGGVYADLYATQS